MQLTHDLFTMYLLILNSNFNMFVMLINMFICFQFNKISQVWEMALNGGMGLERVEWPSENGLNSFIKPWRS